MDKIKKAVEGWRACETVYAAIEMLRPYLGDEVDAFAMVSRDNDYCWWPDGRSKRDCVDVAGPKPIVDLLMPQDPDDFRMFYEENAELMDAATRLPSKWSTSPEEWRLRDV